MHCPDSTIVTNASSNIIPKGITNFHELQINTSALSSPPKEHCLYKLFEQHVAEKRLFYGIEIMTHSYGRQRTLDYNIFNTFLPLFTSIVWVGNDFGNVENINEVDSLRMARKLEKQMVVMPHFTCYNVTHERVIDLLELQFNNLLVLRGDDVLDKQDFKYASELVTEIRSQAGDFISIGVGGYPEGHPDSKSFKKDIHFLKKKVNSGANFIITQICFSSTALIDFVRNCRENGITVPILIGVYIPDNFRSLQRMLQLVQLDMPKDDFEEYKKLKNHAVQFRGFALKRTVEILGTVLGNDEVDVFGLQFFTLNRFQSCQHVLTELSKLQKLQKKYKFF